MKRIVFACIFVVITHFAYSQVVYTFNGNGDWTDASNWVNNLVPPHILSAGSTIHLNSKPGDTCKLNIAQTISSGAILTISPGSIFIISGGLSISGTIAILSTNNITAITISTATCGGNVNSDGGSPITERGICFDTITNPTTGKTKVVIGSGTGIFTGNISGLTENTKYYVRAYAINSMGTAYGNEVSFTTLLKNTITDYDGNVYNTVTIGTQTWLAENLKTTHYKNGDPLTQVTNQSSWADLTTGAYCNLENDVNNGNMYGKLYNWYVVDDSRKIAPEGWHVPTDEEWTTLVTYLGGPSVAGGKMKDTGSVHWCNTNIGATNESGFFAFPGGARTDFIFISYCQWGTWWSATEFDSLASYNRILFNSGTEINRVNNNKKFGMSIRCVKD